MMKRTLLLLLFLFLSALAQDWQSHSYPQDGFEGSTPGPLVMTSDSNATYYAPLT
jgi:hypothetical protein